MSSSWKKFGGIYKSEKFNSIGVGTMVADQVLIRQRVITDSLVEGTLRVGQNVEVGEDVFVGNLLTVSGDAIANKDVYISDKLYFNTFIDTNDNFPAYIAGNSKTGHIGVGTINPTTYIDIDASGSSFIDVLRVKNNNNRIRNILAENKTRSGIAIDVSGHIETIGFYNGDVDISSATPNSTIVADSS